MTTEAFTVPFLTEPGQRHVFENGHTLIYVPKPGRVFNVNTWVRTGSIHEDPVNNGVSHFLEHLMFKGTERFKPGEFDRAMESMGAVINAATWKDFTFYYVTGPNRGEGEFERALDMHADMLLNSTLPEEEVGPTYDPEDASYTGPKRERAVVIEEIGMREDQPWTKVYNSMNELMYPEGHPYRRDVIGTRQIIGNIPRESILAYYKRWYSPQSMATIVTGEFNFEELKDKVAKAFDFSNRPIVKAETAPYTEPSDPQAFRTKYSDKETLVTLQGPYTTNFFMMGFAGPDNADLKTSIALDIVNSVFGEGRSSRLNQNLIEKALVPNFTMLGSSQSTFTLGNVFYIQGNFISPDTENSLGLVKQELSKLTDSDPVTEAEFKRAVQKLKVSFAETAETAAGLGEMIGDYVTVSGKLENFSNYLPTLEHITLDEVRETAKQYLNPEKAYTSVMVPSQAAA